MELHLSNHRRWHELNDQASQILNLPSTTKAAFYQGLSHAIVEIAIGLTKLYPLKKKVYYFKNQSLYFDQAIIQLAKEGYKIVSLENDIFQSPEEWAQKIEREDLFVLYAADDALFGERYDLKVFENSILQKSLIKICVSHAQHFYFNQDLTSNKNTVRIFSLSSRSAIALLGERCRVGSFVGELLDYQPDVIQNVNLILRNQTNATESQMRAQSKSQSLESIVQFESQNVAGATPFFRVQKDSHFKSENQLNWRIYDRAVIFWDDLDASAMIERLAQALDITVAGHLETPCLSRWRDQKLIEYCAARGLTTNQIRGLVIISSSLVELGPRLIETINLVYQSIQADQRGQTTSAR